MGRDVEYDYGCYRCGTLRPRVDRDPDTEQLRCVECGEASVVTFKQALDMINGYHVLHRDEINNLQDYDEYYPDLEYDDITIGGKNET